MGLLGAVQLQRHYKGSPPRLALAATMALSMQPHIATLDEFLPVAVSLTKAVVFCLFSYF